MAISRKNQSFAIGLASAKRRLGRRVYFEARRVAEVIDQDLHSQSPTTGSGPANGSEDAR